MSDLMHFDTNKPLSRAALLVALLLALAGSWFIVRWYLGNTMAEFLITEDSGLVMARRAVSWAPGDPLTHWRLGQTVQTQLPPDHLVQVIKEYEKAVSLSPNDYRFWMALGTALEQSGDVDGGEKALQQAVELAPSYAYPRWYLGNLLLRSGRYAEAFAELRRASEADPGFRSQLFNLVWEVYNQNFELLKTAVGTPATARAEFSQYLLERQRFEDGILLWQSLSEAEKRANRSTGEALISTLVGAKRYHQAVDVSNDLAPTPALRAAEGRFVDPGFEENLTHQAETIFGWKITSVQQAQVGIDRGLGHSGSRSLRIVFQIRSRLASISLSQVVPVAPDTQYDFECYLKTEKLQSGTTPWVEIIDATEGSVVATSEPAPNGNSDWQRIPISLKTGAKTEALTVRINRATCDKDAVCPIFGTVWYDDFNFKRRS